MTLHLLSLQNLSKGSGNGQLMSGIKEGLVNSASFDCQMEKIGSINCLL